MNRKFSRLRQFACPVCDSIVRQSALTDKSAEEAEAERDAKIRKKIKQIYNRPESSFPSQLAFHDYEEMVEDIIYDLVHGINEDTRNHQVELYKIENSDEILVYQSRKTEEERKRLDQIKSDNMLMEAMQTKFLEQNRLNKQRKLEEANQQNTIMLGEENEEALLTKGNQQADIMDTDIPGLGVNAQEQLQEVSHRLRNSTSGSNIQVSDNVFKTFLNMSDRIAPKVLPRGSTPTDGSVAVDANIDTKPSTIVPISAQAELQRVAGGLFYPRMYYSRNMKEFATSLCGVTV